MNETETIDIILVIKSVKSFDVLRYNEAFANSTIENVYIWDEDEIVDYEIFKEGFVLETISIAFSKYLRYLKKEINAKVL